jgi:hypothetical protein
MTEQITWKLISYYEATDKAFRVHILRLYLCLWFSNVNLKKEIKKTGREIRKGNPPTSICVLPTPSGATYTQFPDSCALPFVLREV